MVDKADVDAMSKILQQLDASTKQIVTEHKNDPDMNFAMNIKKDQADNSVAISEYRIVPVKGNLSGFAKTFYNITNSDGVLYENLGLYESAMGIVKHLLYTKKEFKVQNILDQDSAYLGYLSEAMGYKKRLSTLTEGVAHDVASAKYSNAREKMSAAKNKILKSI